MFRKFLLILCVLSLTQFGCSNEDNEGEVEEIEDYTVNIGGGGSIGNYYPTSSGSDYSYEWIAGVQIGSLNNTSGASGYIDFTSQSLNVSPSDTISITLTPGFSGSSYTEYWKIWIDYNQDGDFEDSEEEVFSNSGNSTVSGQFTVPRSITSGATRMRISMSYNIAPPCCESFKYGEVEDYTVNIGSDNGDESPIISASSENPPNETADEAFDGDKNTKWLTFANSGWIQYNYSSEEGAAKTFNEYSITSANDFEERDPRDWKLKGSNNGSNWIILDSQNDVTFSDRFQTKNFTFNNSTAYKIYRLDITSNKNPSSANSTQLAEITFFKDNDPDDDPDPDGGAKHSTVYGGGPFYTGNQTLMDELRSSGFTTIMFWTLHVQSNGDLVYNDSLIVSNGQWVGDPYWPNLVATLKQPPTMINRLQFCVGSWGVADFEHIGQLIAEQGTGPSSVLYKNFQVLQNMLDIDAIDFDDESDYTVNTSVQFGVMLADLGYKVTLCPYTKPSFWKSVYDQINSLRPGTVDRVYLQCYAGGSGNNPGTWNGYFSGLQVSPGLWSKHDNNCSTGDTPNSVKDRLTNWENSYGVDGGFIWLFDDMQKCDNYYPWENYATAINNAVGIGNID